MCVMDINWVLLNRMPNRWGKQEYVKIFDCESITSKSAVKCFERMEIEESIYEGVVEPSHKNPTSEYDNHDGNSRKMRVEVVASKKYLIWVRAPECAETFM